MTSAELQPAVRQSLARSAQHLREYLVRIGTEQALADAERLAADPTDGNYHQIIGPVIASRAYPSAFADALAAHLAAVRVARAPGDSGLRARSCEYLAGCVPARLGVN